MKRVEAWRTLHEMWNDATQEQKEALDVAMDYIEFVDLMPGHGVPLTNAQHIRSMTDEELVEFLDNYKQLLINWLKKPYEEAE